MPLGLLHPGSLNALVQGAAVLEGDDGDGGGDGDGDGDAAGAPGAADNPTSAGCGAAGGGSSSCKRGLLSRGPCCHCGTTSSSQWRGGPPDKPVLCNACGLHFRKERGLPDHTSQVAGALEVRRQWWLGAGKASEAGPAGRC
jgi:hypothetical protein